MKTIDIDPAGAEDVLVRVAEHVPPAVVIGRPLIGWRTETGEVLLLAEGPDGSAIWQLRDGGALAERLLPTSGGVELTRWARGREVSRVLADL